MKSSTNSPTRAPLRWEPVPLQVPAPTLTSPNPTRRSVLGQFSGVQLLRNYPIGCCADRIRLARPEHFEDVCKALGVFGKEIDVFIMAEKRVYVVCVGQNVASPAV